MSSPYHAAYWAHLLSQRGAPDTVERLAPALGSARVDLNPHQIEAALFALRSPLNQGVMLADEVGLGKTIEAGIVLAQRWAEGKRRLLLIVPATLRKQWQTELLEKFRLPSELVDGPRLRREKSTRALTSPTKIVIISYPFAAQQAHLLTDVDWDLVVIDEAHRLRNVFRETSQQANAIKRAIGGRHKVLLTATPLQNTLFELYGLVSLLDEYAFGDLESFREQFVLSSAGTDARNAALRERLRPYCQRTLRQQVQEFVPFTNRIPLLHTFEPSDEEHALYEAVSAFLQREDLYVLAPGQRQLMTLIMRKLLASSSVAIAKTLLGLAERLAPLAQAAGIAVVPAWPVVGENEFEQLPSLRDDWGVAAEQPPISVEAAAIAAELTELRRLTQLAIKLAGGDPNNPATVPADEKGTALLRALPEALQRAEQLGAARKAVIFTESRRTQQYLRLLLDRSGYAGQVVNINGTNTDPVSQRIYEDWKRANPGKVSGVKAADKKAALVDAFRAPGAVILLATESAAEGVNLQFCSLVVNYDLPWNPQRVEQRIGRCHRYGQAHDVVVVNLLNARNAADQRVYKLLDEKFKLFKGVFGASDEVLGAVAAGVNLEKRIAQAYQQSRTADEIKEAFDQLQRDLDEQIQDRLHQTRQDLLDFFDADVLAKLHVYKKKSFELLDEHQRRLHCLAEFELKGQARFGENPAHFEYTGNGYPSGPYYFRWQDAEEHGGYFFAPGNAELADALIETALRRPLPLTHLALDLRNNLPHHAPLEQLDPKTGWLRCSRLRVQTGAEATEALLLTACQSNGHPLDGDTINRILELDHSRPHSAPPPPPPASLQAQVQTQVAAAREAAETRAAHLFDDATDKLNRWAEDKKVGLEAELKALDRAIRDAQTAARQAHSLADKLAGQKRVRDLEQRRSAKRRDLYTEQDKIDERRQELIQQAEKQLRVGENLEEVFTIYWTLE